MGLADCERMDRRDNGKQNRRVCRPCGSRWEANMRTQQERARVGRILVHMSVYEPLVGYIVLEQAQAAVDMLGHRLIHVKKTDLK